MMPIYTLICACGKSSEHIMGMHEHASEVECPYCGSALSRQHNRLWAADRIQIQGDTVPGGCSYDYWDDNLGVRVRSKQHRQNEMLKQGLREYSPDPDLKAARDEAHYIRTHSSRNDFGVTKAVNKVITDASKKKREQRLDAILDKAPPLMLPD